MKKNTFLLLLAFCCSFSACKKGDPGVNGTNGKDGAAGVKGATGPQGPNGPTGPIGPQGPKGDTGSQGPKGDKGDTGAKGSPGNNNIFIEYAVVQPTEWTGTGLYEFDYVPAHPIKTVDASMLWNVPKAGDYMALPFFNGGNVITDIAQPANGQDPGKVILLYGPSDGKKPTLPITFQLSIYTGL